MPFDPDAFLKKPTEPVFDPSGFLAKPSTPEESIISKKGLQAMLGGFGKTATLGYLPQIQTVAEPITDRLLNLLPGEDVQPAPFKQMLPVSEEYLRARDLNIKRQAEMEKASPVSSTIGQVGGALTSALIPMGALAKGGSIGKAAISSGLLGAAQNPGDVEGEINPFQIRDRAKQAATSAAIGGAAQGVVGGLTAAARGLKNLPKSLENVSDSMAFKALGAGKGDIKKMVAKDLEGTSLRALGKFAKEKGLVRGGDNILDVAEKTNRFQEQAGKKIGDIYDDLAQKFGDPNFLNKLPKPQRLEAIKTNFRPKQMAQEFLDEATAKWTGKRGGQAALGRVQTEVDDLMKNKGLLGIKEVHDFRIALDKAIKFEKDEPVQQGLKDFRNFLNKKIENRINFLDKVEGSTKTKALKAANEEYSNIAKINKFVANKVSAEKANNFFGLPDYIIAGGGLAGGLASGATGDDASVEKALSRGLIGLGAGLASRGARKLGAPLVMGGAEKLGGLLKGPAQLIPNIPNLDPRFVGGAAQRFKSLLENK